VDECKPLVCGVPPAMRRNQAPWTVCRVKLVGCPGGRSGATPYACTTWREDTAIDMLPEQSSSSDGAEAGAYTRPLFSST